MLAASSRVGERRSFKPEPPPMVPARRAVRRSARAAGKPARRAYPPWWESDRSSCSSSSNDNPMCRGLATVARPPRSSTPRPANNAQSSLDVTTRLAAPLRSKPITLRARAVGRRTDSSKTAFVNILQFATAVAPDHFRPGLGRRSGCDVGDGFESNRVCRVGERELGRGSRRRAGSWGQTEHLMRKAAQGTVDTTWKPFELLLDDVRPGECGRPCWRNIPDGRASRSRRFPKTG